MGDVIKMKKNDKITGVVIFITKFEFSAIVNKYKNEEMVVTLTSLRNE